LRLEFQRREANPVDVDVFQQSRGRRVLQNRLVARFKGRHRSFTWNGRPQRGRPVTDGQYFARFRMTNSAGQRDVRRVTTLRRRNGRFARRPDFYRRTDCDLLPSYKLSSSAFGGTGGRSLGIAFRVAKAAQVEVTVLKGSRVVRRFAAATRAPNRTHRLRLASRGLGRGDYRVRLTARSGTRRVTSELVARRL